MINQLLHPIILEMSNLIPATEDARNIITQGFERRDR
jgi:hypothetical protein